MRRSRRTQADLFASYLLMPLDDFRAQLSSGVDLDALSHCADRYGVPLTAAVLKWLQYTEEKAVLVMSNDGFINWAWSSEPAFRAGAFFRTRGNVIPVPEQSLAANPEVRHDRRGAEIRASVWFEHADPHMSLREMKLHAGQYDATLSLLWLPRGADAWPPRHRDED
ncbi:MULTISPECIES: ImmA/IrrE family metallo-endopeptidase [Burkholderia cepacia complex]|uniref:ImmA/IrrE family metallo-endopeptidase n=1 Tax=Burkholderia cepacia complex TaxID=87882 RepID=UPI001CF5C7EF|nr:MULTISPECIES: ImmA/IrrE family metallo-endopeptidase [Burkholderia cepacia complex]MCA8057133.1 ImmA/IrrE family metallo-endopeptidase [Burkholderia cepacia]MDN7534677.1 ImmA/IrrE family metallo-endopeptidase [Burkholderia orbicola]